MNIYGYDTLPKSSTGRCVNWKEVAEQCMIIETVDRVFVQVLGYRKDKSASNIYIEFLNTGHSQWIQPHQLVNMGCKDRLAPSTFGVGIIGYPKSKMINTNKVYRTWVAMLARCYDNNSDMHPTYKNGLVTVCDRWHRFDYFEEDVTSIPGYDSWIDCPKGEYSLDKDGLSPKGKPKVYSPSTCQFILTTENSSMTHN